MKNPLVSIILPTFNRESLLRITLESVFAQTMQDFEIVIADDGSDENTLSLLRTVASRPQVTLLEFPHSGSMWAARNAALRTARGEFVAFLDSDDLWASDKLERQVGQLRSGAPAQWSYTGFDCIDAHGVRLAGDLERKWRPHSGDVLRQAITGDISIRTPTVVSRRDLVARAGGFDEQVHNDLHLWICMAELSPIQVVDAPLASIRMHTENHSSNWSYAYVTRERSLCKLERHFGGSLGRLVRRERMRNCLAHANEFLAGDSPSTAMSTWWSGARHSWVRAAWWWGGAKLMARIALPLRRISRQANR